MDTPKIYLPAKTFVGITKTNIKPGQESSLKVGTCMAGCIKEDLQEGKELIIINTGSTSTIVKIIETEAKDFILETETSTYFLRAVSNS